MMKLAFSIGKETFYSYFKRFGYTSKTGIDLPSEAIGYYHSYEDFSNVSLAVYSFGQTFKTTAIQQLRAVSVIANGGYLVEPHLLKEVVDNNGNTIYEYEGQKGNQIISSDVAQTISLILKEGVEGDGGAKNAYVSGYSVAAKTGTSEKKDKYDENGNTSYRVSSCIAYAPSEDAQVAIILMVDEPTVGSKYGSVVAAPYVGALLDAILPYLGVEASYNEDDLEHQEVKVPNLVSLSVDEAKTSLNDLGIECEIFGDGETVINQIPMPGSEMYKMTGKVMLYTSNEIQTHTKVPLLVGKTADEANKMLLNAGLNIKILDGKDFVFGKKATVVAQSLTEGASVPVGTIVTIKIMFTDEED
jgi:stage V sporulation protein D (sporulation-specific penicillin-binding protein)